MKEIKRYNLEVTSMHDAYGCMEESDEGDYVNYSDVEQLQARIKELELEISKLGAKCEEYSWHINKLENVNHINKIKAQGIFEGIDYVHDRISFLADFDAVMLEEYAEQLRNKHE